MEKRDADGADLALVSLSLRVMQLQGAYFDEPSPRTINSRAHDQLMVLKHEKIPPLLALILGKSAAFTPKLAEDFRFIKQEWDERNAIMARNITAAAQQFPAVGWSC